MAGALVRMVSDIRVENSPFMELLIELDSPEAATTAFASPIHNQKRLIGWVRFEFVCVLRGKTIFRAIEMHSAEELIPESLNIFQLHLKNEKLAPKTADWFFPPDSEAIPAEESTWLMHVKGDQVHFRRVQDDINFGFPLESYAIQSRDTAAIYAAAIVNGFQPPRDLRPIDKPIVQIRSEEG